MALNVKVIRDSFAIAKPIAAQVVSRFYEILWSDYPESKALFEHVDMKRQKVALVNSLVKIVDHIEEPEVLLPYLQDMGRRHVAYGAEFPHYDAVGASLIKTFAEFFGRDWTPELDSEWKAAFAFIATTMKSGVAGDMPKPAEVVVAAPVVTEAAAATPVEHDPLLDPIPVLLTEEARQKVRRQAQKAVRQQILDEIRRVEREELSQVDKLGVEGYLKVG